MDKVFSQDKMLPRRAGKKIVPSGSNVAGGRGDAKAPNTTRIKNINVVLKKTQPELKH